MTYLVRFSSIFKNFRDNFDGPENGNNDCKVPSHGKSYSTLSASPVFSTRLSNVLEYDCLKCLKF